MPSLSDIGHHEPLQYVTVFTNGSTELPAASICCPKGRRGQLIRSYLPSTSVSYRQKFQAQGAPSLVSTGMAGVDVCPMLCIILTLKV